LAALLVLSVTLVVALFCGGLGGLAATGGVGGGEVETGEMLICRLLNLVSLSVTAWQPRLHEANR
jgi:hypothetical protein